MIFHRYTCFFFPPAFPRAIYFFANCGPWQQAKHIISYELGTVAIFILQMRKPKQREKNFPW